MRRNTWLWSWRLISHQWRHYLLQNELFIHTDQKSLIHLNEQRLHTPWQRQRVFTKAFAPPFIALSIVEVLRAVWQMQCLVTMPSLRCMAFSVDYSILLPWLGTISSLCALFLVQKKKKIFPWAPNRLYFPLVFLWNWRENKVFFRFPMSTSYNPKTAKGIHPYRISILCFSIVSSQRAPQPSQPQVVRVNERA